jgi:hypothetical protein
MTITLAPNHEKFLESAIGALRGAQSGVDVEKANRAADRRGLSIHEVPHLWQSPHEAFPCA